MSTPLHPFFTHFPIALLVVGLAFEMLAQIRKQPMFGELSFWMLLGASAGAALSVISGGWEADKLKLDQAQQLLVEQHETAAYIAAWLIAALFVWKLLRRQLMQLGEMRMFLGAYLVTVAILLYVGWLGGNLVYSEGIGVQKHTILEDSARSEQLQNPNTDQ